MRIPNRPWLITPILLVLLLAVAVPAYSDLLDRTRHESQDGTLVTLTIFGQVVSTQDAPIEEARVQLLIDSEMMAEDHSDNTGLYVLETTSSLSLLDMSVVSVEIDKAGFRTVRQELTQELLFPTADCCFAHIPGDF